MDYKEKKVKAAFDEINIIASESVATMYEVVQMQNKIIKLLQTLYEAGYTEGTLSNIKDNDQ